MNFINSLFGSEMTTNSTILDIIPVVSYDDTNSCFKMNYKDKIYFLDILQIRSFDLESIKNDDRDYLIEQYERLYKTYVDDIKLVSMNFPVNTITQQHYYNELLEKNDNPIYIELILTEIEKLKILEKEYFNKEFFFFVFGKSIDKVHDNKSKIFGILSSTERKNILAIDKRKKQEVINRMYNS